MVFLSILTAGILLLAAAFAQHQISRFTASRRNIALTRTVLAVVGIAFGYASAQAYAGDSLRAVLAFLEGFGAVHVPAAVILLLKRGRGAGKS